MASAKIIVRLDCNPKPQICIVLGSRDSELKREEGISLVCEAICSGIFNNLGSGSNEDVCVITKGQTEYLCNHQLPNPRTYVSSRGYSFAKGQTEVLSTKIIPLRKQVQVIEGDAMEE